MHQEHFQNPSEEERMTALKEDLKTELMSLRAGERRMEHTPSVLDSQTRESLKKEIIEEMRGSVNPGQLDASDRRMLDIIRDEIRAEMRAQQAYQDHRNRNSNSLHAREIIQDIMEDAREMGYTPGEILNAVQQLQKRGTLRYRFNELMNSREGRGFKWGMSTAFLSMLFLPAMAKSLRPITKWAVKEAMEISEKVQGIVSNLKEDVEDIVAEAQFEKAKNTIDDEIVSEGEAVPVTPTEQ